MRCKRPGCPDIVARGQHVFATVIDERQPYSKAHPHIHKSAWCPKCYTQFEANKYDLRIVSEGATDSRGGSTVLRRVPKQEQEPAPVNYIPIEEIAPVEEALEATEDAEDLEDVKEAKSAQKKQLKKRA